MASSTAPKGSKGEEVINHYGAVRLRVTGSANLQLTLLSLDEVYSNTMVPVPINSVNNVEPNRLANFTQQRAKLQIMTTNINEVFQISKIVIFIRPVAKSFPEII
jgi:hypothetical protein